MFGCVIRFVIVCMVGVEVQSKDRLLLIALPSELREKYARFKEILDGLDCAIDAQQRLEASTLPGMFVVCCDKYCGGLTGLTRCCGFYILFEGDARVEQRLHSGLGCGSLLFR